MQVEKYAIQPQQKVNLIKEILYGFAIIKMFSYTYSWCHENGCFRKRCTLHTLLINTIYISHSTQVAGGTVFRTRTVSYS